MQHHFSEALKIAQVTLNLSTIQLADRIGISDVTLYNWLSQRTYPSLPNRLVAMSRVKELIRGF